MKPKCMFCAREINPDADYRKVEGFERHRSQGGTNAVALRRPTDEWACRWCIEERKRGLVGQESLL